MGQAELKRQPIVEQCRGCDHIQDETCRIWVSPTAKWRTGICPSATHMKREAKTTEQKVRVGQQKQKKK